MCTNIEYHWSKTSYSFLLQIYSMLFSDFLLQERINIETRLERANEAAIRYRDELAEAKDEIKKKDFDLRQIEKVSFI